MMSLLMRLLGLIVLLPCSGGAQGTLLFANRYPWAGERQASALNAPVFIALDPRNGPTIPVEGDRYQAQIFWRPPGQADLQPVGRSTGFLTGQDAGYFNGGVVTIEGAPRGARVQIAVIVWDSSSGPPFRSGGIWGENDYVTLPLGGDGFGDPVPMLTLSPLLLNSILPEPSTNALAACASVIGIGIYWSRRYGQKKQTRRQPDLADSR